jgi:hypothetical protein
MVVAFSSARSVGAGLHSRPMGNPNRMVTPAMKPSSMVDVKLTDLTRLQMTDGGVTTGERAAESYAPVAGHEPLAGLCRRQSQLVSDGTYGHLYRGIGSL